MPFANQVTLSINSTCNSVSSSASKKFILQRSRRLGANKGDKKYYDIFTDSATPSIRPNGDHFTQDQVVTVFWGNTAICDPILAHVQETQRQYAMGFTISMSSPVLIHNKSKIALLIASRLGYKRTWQSFRPHAMEILMPSCTTSLSGPSSHGQKHALRSNFLEIQIRKHRNASSTNLTNSNRIFEAVNLPCAPGFSLCSISIQQFSEPSEVNVGI